MTMLAYSALLTLALLLSAPLWLFRMATTGRYREGLKQRLGFVPAALRVAVEGKRIVWLHAVSVGETLAATRLVAELEAALGEGWRVVVSTTTRTAQALAKERFGADRVFYMPLDFAFAIRAYLKLLKPAALVLMESELWPRLLRECATRGVPVAIANARLSDRSYRRAQRVRAVWSHVLRMPTLWLVQSEEDARRLRSLIQQDTPATTDLSTEAHASTTVISTEAKRSGEIPAFATAHTGKPAIRITGNLKYDIRAPKQTELTQRIRKLIGSRPVVIAGSTTASVSALGSTPYVHTDEEDQIIGRWSFVLTKFPNALLIVAPRHPERFGDTEAYMRQTRGTNATELTYVEAKGFADDVEVLCLNTIGDLASMYQLADIAFVGGSLVPRGGHNPLEPAQFGVPVVMGPSFENFRDIVGKLQAAEGIRIVQDAAELEATLTHLLTHPEEARALGERGRAVFEAQQGATARTVAALLGLLQQPAKGTPPFANDAKDGAPGILDGAPGLVAGASGAEGWL